MLCKPSYVGLSNMVFPHIQFPHFSFSLIYREVSDFITSRAELQDCIVAKKKKKNQKMH